MQKTYGDFLNAVVREDFVEYESWMEEWKKGFEAAEGIPKVGSTVAKSIPFQKAHWERAYRVKLTPDLIVSFMADMVAIFQGRKKRLDRNSPLYDLILSDQRAFLSYVREVAQNFGVNPGKKVHRLHHLIVRSVALVK